MAIYIRITGSVTTANESHELVRVYPFAPACTDVDLAAQAATGAFLYESVSEYGVEPQLISVENGEGTWLEDLGDDEELIIGEYKEED